MPDVAQYVLHRLREWGVHRIYGYPGDGINGFLGAFEEVDGDPVFTQTRHEEMAAFMACAHAKFTGQIGACIATSGPGAIHLANGLYDAKLDHQPVIAIAGQQKRQSVGAHFQQEIDLQSFFKDIAGFVSTVMDQHSARHVLDCAMKSALTERRPAVVIVPEDVQESEFTGSIGLLGTEPSHKMVMGCDTLFMIGTSFPYAEWLPPQGQARCVEIDIDGSMIGVRYPDDVSLVGDAKDTLQALLPLLKHPLNPQLVFHELDKRLPDTVIMTSDSGSATNWFARHIKIREGMQSSLSGTLATMLPGVPYAISAKFAFPERPVIAFTGDGAFSMLGMNELLTAKRYAGELLQANTTLIFTVLVNEDLNQVSYEQRVLSSDPKNPMTQDVPYVPCCGAREAARLRGHQGDPAAGRRAGVGPRARSRQAGAHGVRHRPRGAATSAAREAGHAQEDRQGSPEGARR